MRTTVDIDDEALAAAAAVLGTSTKVDTVNRALAEIAARPRRVAAVERLLAATDDLGGAETIRRGGEQVGGVPQRLDGAVQGVGDGSLDLLGIAAGTGHGGAV